MAERAWHLDHTDPRLGRNVRHDPRSLAFKVAAPADVKPTTKQWSRALPVLDQGQLGSCTGNAGTGVLGSEVLYATLPGEVRQRLAGAESGEAYAVALYSDATKLDSEPANYPPTDTGSDGLSIAQVLKARGLINGYQHVTSLQAAYAAILDGPFIIGSNWYSGFFAPDRSGLVKITGTPQGGHEYECLGYDAAADRWHLVNSWGTGWGDSGHFYYSSATLTRLLAEQGDATTFVPITVPAPVPVATPLATARAVLDPWAAKHHLGVNGAAAAAWQAYSASLA